MSSRPALLDSQGFVIRYCTPIAKWSVSSQSASMVRSISESRFTSMKPNGPRGVVNRLVAEIRLTSVANPQTIG